MRFPYTKWFSMIPYPMCLAGITLLAGSTTRWAGAVLIVLAAIVAVFPFGRRWFLRKWRRVWVFSGDDRGSSFILEQIREACRNGGTIFSTYLLERADGDDVVYKILADEAEKSQSRATVEYERLVLIDDPTQEEKWITQFLGLAREPNNGSGVTIRPRILAIRSPNRPVVRLLQAILLRVSLTLIDRSPGGRGKLAYVSLSDVFSLKGEGSRIEPRFAVAIRGDVVHDHLRWFVSNVVDANRPHIRTLSSQDDYHRRTLAPHPDALSLRLMNAIEECALADINIKHVGVFGSVATFSHQSQDVQTAHGDRWRHESDLDLIVVVANGANLDTIRSDISNSLRSQANEESRKTLDIEWSKEGSYFYYFRKGFHVDIQLHEDGDNYYLETTRLLGYSIFGSPYHVLYSERNQPVDSFLKIPNAILRLHERVNLFLEDPLGLVAFIRRCSAGDRRIDPRRVIAINVRNLVWTISGMHARGLKQSIRFLRATGAHRDLGLTEPDHKKLVEDMKRILSAKLDEKDDSEQPALLKDATDVLRRIQEASHILAGSGRDSEGT